MKYSDQQRIEKIRETTGKLLNYAQREQITPEKICNEETIQWTVTTPLYNIGEHVYNLSDEFKKSPSGNSVDQNCRTAAPAGAPL